MWAVFLARGRCYLSNSWIRQSTKNYQRRRVPVFNVERPNSFTRIKYFRAIDRTESEKGLTNKRITSYIENKCSRTEHTSSGNLKKVDKGLKFILERGKIENRYARLSEIELFPQESAYMTFALSRWEMLPKSPML